MMYPRKRKKNETSCHRHTTAATMKAKTAVLSRVFISQFTCLKLGYRMVLTIKNETKMRIKGSANAHSRSSRALADKLSSNKTSEATVPAAAGIGRPTKSLFDS